MAVQLKGLALHQAAAASKAEYYAKRVALFETYTARAKAELEVARQAASPISITLPNGSVKPGVAWVTTPLDVAAAISKQLVSSIVVAKVNDAVWDVFRPLEGDCTLKLCTFEDPEGRDVRFTCLDFLGLAAHAHTPDLLAQQRTHARRSAGAGVWVRPHHRTIARGGAPCCLLLRASSVL